MSQKITTIVEGASGVGTYSSLAIPFERTKFEKAIMQFIAPPSHGGTNTALDVQGSLDGGTTWFTTATDASPTYPVTLEDVRIYPHMRISYTIGGTPTTDVTAVAYLWQG